MSKKPFTVFIGYDPQEPLALHVLTHSIMRHASGPVAIVPLVQGHLRQRGIYTRDRGPTESTEFSLTRFLVPYLSDYGGLSLFLDCDMLCKGDVYELMTYAREAPITAVYCVQHDYKPRHASKFLGHAQTTYEKKNWSSVMLFRNKYCTALTPEYVNHASGLDLHQFRWLNTPQLDIQPLPIEWNWLVGQYPQNPDAKLLHFTEGGPWFRDYQFCDYANDWFKEFERAAPSLNMPKPERNHAAVSI